MIFTHANHLNLDVFDPTLRQQTNDLRAVLDLANKYESQQIESTHFLIALASIPNGFTSTLFLDQRKLHPQSIVNGLVSCIGGVQSAAPLLALTPDVFDTSAAGLVSTLERDLTDHGGKIDERRLLLSMLDHLTPDVVTWLRDLNLTPAHLREVIGDTTPRPSAVIPFLENGDLNRKAFAPSALHVLSAMQTEAEAMGSTEIDPRHLLIGLLDKSDGAGQLCLYQQNHDPNVVREQLIKALRQRALPQPSELTLTRHIMKPLLVEIIEAAGGAVKGNEPPRIADVHLLRAFLNVDSFALRQLPAQGVDLDKARAFATRLIATPEADVSRKRTQAEVETELRNCLVGQEDAIQMCMPFISRTLFDFQRIGRPAGVFLFCGPSGTGKTEMAKAIARSVFGSDRNHFVRMDMGQFKTKESMSIFIGAPPGYVGYGAGKLTNGLREKPRSVVLFDEVEKADDEVFDVLLRFIDEGEIDDPAGGTVNGTQCIIVMTSNISTAGLEQLVLKQGDFTKNKWEIRRKLRGELGAVRIARTSSEGHQRSDFSFRPEFLNRIDEIILFRALDKSDMATIALRNIRASVGRLETEKSIALRVHPEGEVAQYIGIFCQSLNEGARAIPRLIDSCIIDPVIEFVITEGVSGSPKAPLVLDMHFPEHLNVPGKEPEGRVTFAER